MAEYEGTYQSEEADAIVTLVVRNNKLALRTRKFEEPRPPGDSAAAHGWYPLEAVCADAFKEEWIGLLRFTRDSNKQITGFVVSNRALLGNLVNSIVRFTSGHERLNIVSFVPVPAEKNTNRGEK
jgi:hypothetical protein